MDVSEVGFADALYSSLVRCASERGSNWEVTRLAARALPNTHVPEELPTPLTLSFVPRRTEVVHEEATQLRRSFRDGAWACGALQTVRSDGALDG